MINLEKYLKLAMRAAHKHKRRLGTLSDKFDIEDLKGEALYHLCRAEQTFDPELGYAFSTYMCKVVEQGLMNYTQRDKTVWARRGVIAPLLVSMSSPIDEEEDLLLEDTISDTTDYIAEMLIDLDYKDIFNRLTDKETEILKLLLEERKQVEIARILDTDPVSLYRVIKRMRYKLRKYFKEEKEMENNE